MSIFAPEVTTIISNLENYKVFGMKKTKVTFDVEKLEYSVELARALAHPLRMKILEFIDQKGAINVNKIYHSLKLEQSITSQHLRILRDNGLVTTQREGKSIYYLIDRPFLTRSMEVINGFDSMTLAHRKKKR